MIVSRRSLLFGGTALVAAGAGAWWRQRRDAAPGGEVLDAAFWSQSFERPEGGALALASLRGQRAVLNFWATWCPPCVEELPMLDRFFREHSANGWQVVGLAIDQPSAVRKFLERMPLSFPNGLAGLQGTELVKQLGNTSGGLPFSLLVDAAGQIQARKMGKLEIGDLDAWRHQLSAG